MKYYQKYCAYSPNIDCPEFPACVPGNVQLDYITAHPEFVSDINYGMEHKKMTELEPYTWYYRTKLDFKRSEGEKIWFVTEGIDYRWSLILGDSEFYSHEGMFSRAEVCLDDAAENIFGRELQCGDELKIRILPHPMLEGKSMDRQQAAQCCKPPVAYEWDWHPRVIPSGIWDETYLESRTDEYLGLCEAGYRLSDDLKTAMLTIKVGTALEADVTVMSPDGKTVASGVSANGCFNAKIDDVKLWWCRGYGSPELYTYTVALGSQVRTGHIGFRKIQLVLNCGTPIDPNGFPKSRAYPPACLELNGVKVFAKGSNYVNQEIFTGTMDSGKYEKLIKYACEANMNIFRCWGGTGAQKDDFYSLCDRYGIMIWFEFPLACNNYYDSAEYLSVLTQEAAALLLKLRSHPCISLWCGGNELFNGWSGMTDQHLALRLLNSLTLQYSPEIPFIPTSPIHGIKHGGYTFIDGQTGKDQFELFGSSQATAYTEFGIPSTPSCEYLRSFIPEEELFPPKRGGTWEAHHAFNAWGSDQWLSLPALERFGDISSLESLVETSGWLQQIGYKAIFEEARRQKPFCAMAINWCWCEPWKCAANNSLIAYPDVKKSGYFAVKDSLRDITPSAKIPKFSWKPDEVFETEAWLLNDGISPSDGNIKVFVELNGTETYLGECAISTKSNENSRGQKFSYAIPSDTPAKSRLNLRLDYFSSTGETISNEYSLAIESK